MSTRGFIGQVGAGGAITAAYHHWDSYPTGLGATLAAHYTDPEKIAALIALGDSSSIGPEIGEKHDFDARTERYNPRTGQYEPVPELAHTANWSKFYHRDRGESWEQVKPRTFETETEFLAAATQCGAEYAYLWRDGGWVCFDNDGMAFFGSPSAPGWAAAVPLAEAIKAEQTEMARG